MDRGYTFRMTSKEKLLENIKNINWGEVVMGNNVTYRVEGIGIVTLKFINEYIFTT